METWISNGTSNRCRNQLRTPAQQPHRHLRHRNPPVHQSRQVRHQVVQKNQSGPRTNARRNPLRQQTKTAHGNKGMAPRVSRLQTPAATIPTQNGIPTPTNTRGNGYNRPSGNPEPDTTHQGATTRHAATSTRRNTENTDGA